MKRKWTRNTSTLRDLSIASRIMRCSLDEAFAKFICTVLEAISKSKHFDKLETSSYAERVTTVAYSFATSAGVSCKMGFQHLDLYPRNIPESKASNSRKIHKSRRVGTKFFDALCLERMKILFSLFDTFLLCLQNLCRRIKGQPPRRTVSLFIGK